MIKKVSGARSQISQLYVYICNCSNVCPLVCNKGMCVAVVTESMEGTTSLLTIVLNLVFFWGAHA